MITGLVIIQNTFLMLPIQSLNSGPSLHLLDKAFFCQDFINQVSDQDLFKISAVCKYYFSYFYPFCQLMQKLSMHKKKRKNFVLSESDSILINL